MTLPIGPANKNRKVFGNPTNLLRTRALSAGFPEVPGENKSDLFAFTSYSSALLGRFETAIRHNRHSKKLSRDGHDLSDNFGILMVAKLGRSVKSLRIGMDHERVALQAATCAQV